jgi:hypothetical protein
MSSKEDPQSRRVLPGDFLLGELADSADRIVRAGGNVYMKWTCRGCGERVMAGTPNVFWTAMRHEDCGHVTDTGKLGGNYLAVMDPEAAQLAESMAAAETREKVN